MNIGTMTELAGSWLRQKYVQQTCRIMIYLMIVQGKKKATMDLKDEAKDD